MGLLSMAEPEIPLDSIAFVGTGLVRPECVLATADGSLWTADWRGGVARLLPDGGQTLFTAVDPPFPLKPNGIALKPDGSFLLAHLGDEGGLWHLTRAGRLTPVCCRVDGIDLPPCNFVLLDRSGAAWLTVSTRQKPRALGYRKDVADGFIVRIAPDGRAAIVADGLGYTNEVALSADEEWLYVNETFGRRLSRFPVRPDGRLGQRETVTHFGSGTFPDGLVFDVAGHAWVTSIVSNRVIRVAPDGAQTLVLEDSHPEHLAWCEDAFESGTLDRPHLDTLRSRSLRNISSLAFGGPDLRTAYLGCLLGESVAMFRTPVAGRPPVHWPVR